MAIETTLPQPATESSAMTDRLGNITTEEFDRICARRMTRRMTLCAVLIVPLALGYLWFMTSAVAPLDGWARWIMSIVPAVVGFAPIWLFFFLPSSLMHRRLRTHGYTRLTLGDSTSIFLYFGFKALWLPLPRVEDISTIPRHGLRKRAFLAYCIEQRNAIGLGR